MVVYSSKNQIDIHTVTGAKWEGKRSSESNYLQGKVIKILHDFTVAVAGIDDLLGHCTTK